MSFLPNLSPGNVPNVLPTDWEYDVNYKWTRPTEWLDLNVPDGVPEKIIALVAVYPNDERPAQNYVAFNLDTAGGSSYSVNWGDGNVETLASDATHHHVYDYDDLPANTEFRGYRQARLEVTLNQGVTFDSNGINFDVDGPFVTNASYAYRCGPNILDLFVSTSVSTDVRLNYTRPMRMVEQIEFRNTSSNRLLTPEYIYQGTQSLKSIPFVPYVRNAGSESYTRAFNNCIVLDFLPDEFANPEKYWFKNPSSLQQTFSNCYNLRYLPAGLFGEPGSILSSCSNYYLLFDDCRKLKFIPYIGMRTNADIRVDYMFHNCSVLRALPQGFNWSRANGSGIDRIFSGLTKCTDFSVISGGLDEIERTANFDMSQAFYNLDGLVEFPYIGQFTRCTNSTNLFSQCSNLQRFDSQYDHIDLTNCTDFQQTFFAMESLKELPIIKINNATDSNAFYQTFYNSHSLTSITLSGMNQGPSNGEYFRMFYNCYSLQYIEGVDFSYANDAGDYTQIFNTCRNINYIKFPGGATDETGFKYSVSLRYCPLNRDAMLEIFNHLVTITHSATLTLTNNSYTADLTDADKLIATNKGWTLSI